MAWQSPDTLLHSKNALDITGDIYICDEKCLFTFNNTEQSELNIKNENDLLTITTTGNSTINFLSEDACPEYDEYTLKQIIINAPSRHSIYGKRFPMEFELVYLSQDNKETVAVSVFGEVGNTDNKLLNDIATKFFPQHLKSISTKYNWDVEQLLPKRLDRTFFTYQRTKELKNIIFETPINVPAALLNNFKSYVTTTAKFNSALKGSGAKVNGDVIIYATVPPPVNNLPKQDVNIIEPFDNVRIIEHYDNPSAQQEYGFAPFIAFIFALLFILILLFVFKAVAPTSTMLLTAINYVTNNTQVALVGSSVYLLAVLTVMVLMELLGWFKGYSFWAKVFIYMGLYVVGIVVPLVIFGVGGLSYLSGKGIIWLINLFPSLDMCEP